MLVTSKLVTLAPCLVFIFCIVRVQGHLSTRHRCTWTGSLPGASVQLLPFRRTQGPLHQSPIHICSRVAPRLLGRKKSELNVCVSAHSPGGPAPPVWKQVTPQGIPCPTLLWASLSSSLWSPSAPLFPDLSHPPPFLQGVLSTTPHFFPGSRYVSRTGPSSKSYLLPILPACYQNDLFKTKTRPRFPFTVFPSVPPSIVKIIRRKCLNSLEPQAQVSSVLPAGLLREHCLLSLLLLQVQTLGGHCGLTAAASASQEEHRGRRATCDAREARTQRPVLRLHCTLKFMGPFNSSDAGTLLRGS